MSGTRRKPGRMGSHIVGFAARLADFGYTPGTIRGLLKTAGQLGRWMERENIEFAELTVATFDNFRIAAGEGGRRAVPSAGSMVALCDYLRSTGEIGIEMPVLLTPVGELLVEYRVWLTGERGLAAPTVLRYVNLARRFLSERLEAAGDRFVMELAAVDVIEFLVRETDRLAVGSAKGRVGELRSLLKYLYLRGLTPLALAPAIPTVAGWHDTTVPNGLSPLDVQRLVDTCDQATTIGRRDHAILLLVARLGLRSIEVARLELGDIDWRAGEILVRGKARRQDRLPLPCDVGEALAAYLRDGRPATPIRHVFLATKAPRRAIRADLVSDVNRRACDRAGLARVGAHRLRHALATELLSKGATLVEVSQVLRHRDLATTAIYAKVDLNTLRRVAQPWPGATR